MGIRRQSVAADFESEVVEMHLVEAPLEKRAGIYARNCVTLDVDVVTGVAARLAAEKVVEANLVERGRRGEGREVAADSLLAVVGFDHHHRRVPPDIAA